MLVRLPGCPGLEVALSVRLAVTLSIKEMVRNAPRFASISAVIALITVLILFLAGLGEGLALGNRQFLERIDGDLLVYQETADLQIAASQFDGSVLASIRRVDGVADLGALAFSSTVVEPLDAAGSDGAEDGAQADGALGGERVALIGVEPGRPGAPPVREGRTFTSLDANEAIFGARAALFTGAEVGDVVTVRSTQGAVDERYDLRVVGIANGQQYQISASILTPLVTFERVRPKADAAVDPRRLLFDVVAVRAADGVPPATLKERLEREVRGVEAVDLVTAYTNVPGYTAQESTVNTQTFFTLIIGVLVVGGFFQIQTLQKVPQIGMLRAIGASGGLIAWATVLQIVFTNLVGVALGALGTAGLAASFPPQVPIEFRPTNVGTAIAGLLIIGPAGGLVALRAALRVEPLTALGLGK